MISPMARQSSAAARTRLEPPPPVPVVEGPAPAVLDAIRRSEVAFALWHRPSPWPAGRTIPAIALDLETAPETAAEAIAEAAGPALGPAVVADAAALAARLAGIAGAFRLRLRLERIATDACTRFHADYVTLRLLTTYAGPGTEWRRAPEGPVRRMPAGSVAILKGRLLLEPPPVLHRSPPVEAQGQTRLVLAVDPLA